MRVDQTHRLGRERMGVEHGSQLPVAELIAHHVGQHDRDAVSQLGGLNGGDRVVDFEGRA